ASCSLTVDNEGTMSSNGTTGITLTGPAGLTLDGNGSLSTFAANFNSTSGAVSASQTSILGVVQGTAATSFTLSTASTTDNLTVGNIRANNGSVTITTSAPQLLVSPNSTIQSNGDQVNTTIQNLNITAGTIVIGSGATVESNATTDFFGNVYIVMGAIPTNPVAGSKPTNVFFFQQSAGSVDTIAQVDYGTNGITANQPTDNVTINGAVVIFNTGSLPASAITLDGGTNISASSTQTSAVLQNLNFADPKTIQYVQLDQTNGVLGGSLAPDGTGTVTLSPRWLAPVLTGANIVGGLSVTMQGFSASTPVTINNTSQFIQIQNGGSLRFSNSDGAIILQGTGSFMQLDGPLSADGALSIQMNGTLVIQSFGSISGGTSVSLAVSGVSNTGNIWCTQCAANAIQAPLVTLTTTGQGGIGTLVS